MQAIEFSYEISQNSIEALLEELRKPNTPQNVFVSSPGGTFDFFSRLGPAIERRGITTIAGNVRSAAVILYLLGHNRLAFPTSIFYFHEVRALVKPFGQITIAELEDVEEYRQQMEEESREVYQEWLAQMKSAQSWFLGFLSSKTGIVPSTFLNLMRKEVVMTASDAMRYGIVHEVISARIME